MWKIILTLFLTISFHSSIPKRAVTKVNEDDLSLHTESAILIEANTGKVIYEKNADEQHYPASMTKMMGMYLVLRSIEEGKITFDDEVTCSPYAASMGGTQIYLEPGERMSVRDLFKAVAINSANDAITALGEHIAGNNEDFVKMMNKTAKELGMRNTIFKNPTGFDDPDHKTTPRDMALVALKLVSYGETLFQFTRLKEAYVREGSSSPFWLVNTNKMLGYYEGMDGLKTGYTSMAKYNLTATAMRSGIRLISVVMNESSIAERSQDTTTLLNTGFSKLCLLKIFPAHEAIANYTFKRAKQKETPIYTKNEVNIICDKGSKIEDLTAKIELTKIYAPIAANEIIGYLVLTDDKNEEYRFPIMVQENIELMSFIDHLKEMILRLLA